ncbi:WhiB family transcriptional regulator [Streptomyces sp. NPDC002232]|uniref:WhiB family transcriptional regulator n=1 Tax=Streptomyces sp. NPDC002232 TaxID=3364640 RepID=UPI0036A5C733
MNRTSIVRTVYYGAVSTATTPERPRAACADVDPELFFPTGDNGPTLLQEQEAKAVCRRCPLQAPCLQGALDRGETAGVWGGMSERERRSLKRRTAHTSAA